MSISRSLSVVSIYENNYTAINNRLNPKQYVLNSDKQFLNFVSYALFKCMNKLLYDVIIFLFNFIIRSLSISRYL